jgi:glutathione synthase/RimK-type ligase-like ATP-grasp enzyme
MHAPGGPSELFYRACLLDRLGRTPEARQAYFDVLAQDMGHAGALANLGALLLANGYRKAALTTYTQAVQAHPGDPAARVNLANLLREAHQPRAACDHYEAALAIDPAYPEAHQGLSYLLDGVNEAAASHHRALGFANRAVVSSPYRGERAPVSVLHLVSARGNNIPMRAILDDRIFLIHTVIAEYAASGHLPPHDVVFNAIGDADSCADALQAAARLIAPLPAPVINPPARVLPTARVNNVQRLAAVPGVLAPRTVLLPRQQLAAGVPPGFRLPFLLRSPGFHTGQHFLRVNDAAALDTIVAALPGEHLLAVEYLDATDAGGASRKYRALLIGGEILPLHLAVSADWKVHYFTADMASKPEQREEEARYLASPETVLGPVAMRALAGIQSVLGLDYAGVDFALARDGRLILFEANATMALVPPSDNPIYRYRHPAFERAKQAATALILSRAIKPEAQA